MEPRQWRSQREEAQVNGFLLDTHAWLWAQIQDSRKVSATFFSDVESWQRQERVYISDISVLELARLDLEQEVILGTSIDNFVAQAVADDGFRLLPLTTRILIESTRLPGNIHRDPADRLLVSTAREHGLTLVTRDKPLLSYARQGHLNARKP